MADGQSRFKICPAFRGTSFSTIYRYLNRPCARSSGHRQLIGIGGSYSSHIASSTSSHCSYHLEMKLEFKIAQKISNFGPKVEFLAI